MIKINDRGTNGTPSNVLLPDPAEISDTKVREAAEKFVAVHSARGDSFKRRDKARGAHVAAIATDEAESADNLYDNPDADLPAPRAATIKAEAEFNDAQAVASAFNVAFGKSYVNLMHTIDERGEAWREKLLKDAEKSVIKLATALKMAEVADHELKVSLGLLEMLADNLKRVEAGGRGVPVMRPAPHTVHTTGAIKELHAGVGSAMARVREL